MEFVLTGQPNTMVLYQDRLDEAYHHRFLDIARTFKVARVLAKTKNRPYLKVLEEELTDVRRYCSSYECHKILMLQDVIPGAFINHNGIKVSGPVNEVPEDISKFFEISMTHPDEVIREIAFLAIPYYDRFRHMDQYESQQKDFHLIESGM
jgi:hypothetical protein